MMMTTKRMKTTDECVQNAYEAILDVLQHSALTSSHAVIEQQVQGLAAVANAICWLPDADDVTRRLVTYLQRVIEHLQGSYACALDNNWAQADYLQSVAMIDFEAASQLLRRYQAA